MTNVLVYDAMDIDAGDEEEFEFWVQGYGTNTLGNTATHGTPNTGKILGVIDGRTLLCGDSGSGLATWFPTGVGGGKFSWSETGHYVEFVDSGGNRTGVASRTIIHVPGNYQLSVHPPLTQAESATAQAAGWYYIKKLPEWQFVNLAMAARPRTA
jgi:hypothetical protein